LSVKISHDETGGAGVLTPRRDATGSDRTGPWLFALATLLLHFLVNGRYGYWVDELYFMACGEHLAWGYVDQPPLIAVIAAASRSLLGDSLFAIRFFPAVAAAATVLLTGMMARELGGGRFARSLAAVTVIVGPIYLGFGNLLTMNAFEPFLWVLCAYLTVRILKTNEHRRWLLVGCVCGIGLLNKYSMAFFGFGLVVGLLLTPQRVLLRDRWIWLAGGLAFLIFLPHVMWEATNGFPSVELLRNAKLYQHTTVSPLEFIWGQILIVHPLTLPVWLAGVYFYLGSEQGRPYRLLGWTSVAIFGLFMLLQAKTYYPAPLYPMLFAAGAVAIERYTAPRRRRWVRVASVVVLLAGGALTAPYALPVLPIEQLVAYMRTVSIREVRPERRKVGVLPQIFADMLGWENFVAHVGEAYKSLPPEERGECAILASDYGKAGAVDFFGGAYGLPKALSGHQNYYLWGPRNYSGALVLALGFSGDDLRQVFNEVTQADVVTCEHCMPDNQEIPIFVARGLKMPLSVFWPQLKCYTCDAPAFITARR
jgi:4-amino-4-deoxy-L-arabinose transferase-like glycosyltransferase